MVVLWLYFNVENLFLILLVILDVVIYGHSYSACTMQCLKMDAERKAKNKKLAWHGFMLKEQFLWKNIFWAHLYIWFIIKYIRYKFIFQSLVCFVHESIGKYWNLLSSRFVYTWDYKKKWWLNLYLNLLKKIFVEFIGETVRKYCPGLYLSLYININWVYT